MLYIVYVDLLYDRGLIGIKKKILAQINVFSKVYEKVFYTVYCGQMMYLLLDDEIIEKEIALTKQDCNNCILEWIDKYKITKTYIRYNYADKWFLQFLEGQKNRGIVSVLEFPTIPYDGELSNKRVIAEDKFYRKEMLNYIDKCTTYGDYDKVFGISCCPLLNGVDIEQFEVRKQTDKKQEDGIVLIAVASMAKWHGYERIIEGLADYYKGNIKRQIILKLVGEGSETDRYRNIVKTNGLESYVYLCGKLEGEELNRLYNEADIAVGTLGMYKVGVNQGAPIKLREYCIRGLPFIYGYNDTGLNGDEYFAMRVPNNKENINMNKVLEFYDEVIKHENCAKEIRAYAEQKYSWDVILKPVIEYFDNPIVK